MRSPPRASVVVATALVVAIVCSAGLSRVEGSGSGLTLPETHEAHQHQHHAPVSPSSITPTSGELLTRSDRPLVIPGGVPVSPVSPMLACPRNYVQNGKACTKIEYAEFTHGCPKGSRMERNACFTRDIVDAQLACPIGFTPNHDHRCEKVDKIPVRRECEKDFLFENNNCVKRTKIDTHLQCPKGYKAEGVSCIKYIRTEAQTTCPAETTLVPNTKDRCERKEALPAIVICPQDYVVRDNECVREEVVEAKMECEKNFRLEDKQCVRKFDAGHLGMMCPEGTFKGAKKCELLKTVMGMPVCRKDFTYKNGKCLRVIEEAPEIICEKGYKHLEDGRCEKRIDIEGQLVCPPGTVQDGKRCVSLETTAAKLSCPKDFESVENRCMRISRKTPEVSCARGFKAVGLMCISNGEVKADHKCPQGTILRGRICETIEVIGASKSCKRGHLENGVCVETSTKALKLSCPKGFRHEGNACVMRYYTKQEPVCRVGVPKGDKCEVIVTFPTSPTCPKGFVVGLSRKCQRTHVVEAKHICPQGSRLVDGLCVERRVHSEGTS